MMEYDLNLVGQEQDPTQNMNTIDQQWNKIINLEFPSGSSTVCNLWVFSVKTRTALALAADQIRSEPSLSIIISFIHCSCKFFNKI